MKQENYDISRYNSAFSLLAYLLFWFRCAKIEDGTDRASRLHLFQFKSRAYGMTAGLELCASVLIRLHAVRHFADQFGCFFPGFGLRFYLVCHRRQKQIQFRLCHVVVHSFLPPCQVNFSEHCRAVAVCGVHVAPSAAPAQHPAIWHYHIFQYLFAGCALASDGVYPVYGLYNSIGCTPLSSSFHIF